MKVELISPQQDYLRLCYNAARECYDSPQDASKEYQTKVVVNCIKSGHLSILEHAVFQFRISGISRVTSHQLVRYRVASFAQKSQRYCDESPLKVVIPETIKAEMARNILVNKAAKQLLEDCSSLYKDLIALGIPKEDARYLLPQGYETSLVVSMNARELFHFLKERLCKRAQWEIRQIASEIRKHCLTVAPEIFNHSGTNCKNCTEKKPKECL